MFNYLKFNILVLNLEKPLFQATIADLKEVLAEVLKDNELENEGKTASTPKRYVYGIAGLAKLLGCSQATAQRIKSSGVIDDAISQHGGIVVTDGDYALDLLRVSKKYRNTSLKRTTK